MDSRTATDAVHERLQAINFYCNTCNAEFKAKEIAEHFASIRAHKSKGKCSYCQGTDCYSYIDNMKKDRVWHKCPKL